MSRGNQQQHAAPVLHCGTHNAEPASGALPYTTAAAFRAALKARFAAIAKQD